MYTTICSDTKLAEIILEQSSPKTACFFLLVPNSQAYLVFHQLIKLKAVATEELKAVRCYQKKIDSDPKASFASKMNIRAAMVDFWQARMP